MSKSIKILADGRKMIQFHLLESSDLSLERKALAHDQSLALRRDLGLESSAEESDPLATVFQSSSESHLSTVLDF